MTLSAMGGCPLLGLELVADRATQPRARAELSRVAVRPSVSLGPTTVFLQAPRWPNCSGPTPFPRPEERQQVPPRTVTVQG